jgi:hypothetical protein
MKGRVLASFWEKHFARQDETRVECAVGLRRNKFGSSIVEFPGGRGGFFKRNKTIEGYRKNVSP